jgi:hypothetical protein
MNTGASSFFRLTILLCTLIAVRAHGQEEISFCNSCLPSPPDRLVRDVNGNPLVGTNYLAQLYYGSTPDTLVAHTAAPARFRPAATVLPGTWTGAPNRTVVLPNPAAIVLQVRVWDIAAGLTYEQASRNTVGLQYGKSEAFTYEPCGVPRRSADCDKMVNFRGFALVTNPPPDTSGDLTLAIRENGDLVDVVYSGTHTIQAAPSIRGPWTTVHSSAGPFTDPASATNSVRFYRMMDEPGPTFSVNAVGYYRLSLCSGFSLIANQLHAPGGNKISELFKSSPEGTRIYKFNPMTGGFVLAQFVDGEWDNPDLELIPGQGAFLWSSAASHRFVGEISMLATVAIPTGFSLISNPLPETGPVNLLPPNGMGLPIRDGTVIYQWNCATQSFVISQFVDGQWDPGGSTVGPTVGIGEAFYFFNPGQPLVWTRSFTVGP